MKYLHKNRKLLCKLAALSLVAALLSTSVSAADNWTPKQNKAHEIAELARSLNLPEDNPIIVEAQRLWFEDYATETVSQPPQQIYTDDDATILAKIMYSECRGIASDTEKACIAWVVLNRVDAGYGTTITEVATAPAQFAYRSRNPVWDDLLALSKDVLTRWQKEKQGETEVGRVIPKDYLWYSGDGAHNYFRNAYSGGTKWDYSLTSPYQT